MYSNQLSPPPGPLQTPPDPSLVQCDEELAAVGVWLILVGTRHQPPVAEPQAAVEFIFERTPINRLAPWRDGVGGPVGGCEAQG